MAADEYFRAGDARKEREYLQEKRDSELRLLPEQERAQRAQLGLHVAQNEANRGLVPQQTQTAQLEQQARQGELRGTLAAQPDLQTAKVTAARTQRRVTEFEASDLGRKLYEQRLAGAISKEQMHQKVLSTLAELIDQGDEKSVIGFVNSFGVPQGAKPVVSIRVENKDGQKFFRAISNDGKPVLNLSSVMLAKIRASQSGVKPETLTLKGGETVVNVQGGKATPLYTAPESAKSRAERMGPLQRDVDYLVSAHGMTNEQALAHLNSAKTKSRAQFVIDQVNNMATLNKTPTQAQLEEFGAMYDRIQGTVASGLQPQTSNSSAPSTVDPQLRSLLGLP